MPQVRMPDGAFVAFPDNMPPEQIRSLIATKFPEAAKGHVVPPPHGSDLGEGRAALQGATSVMPFSRKITSAGGAAIAKLAGVDEPFSDLYRQAEANALATEEANPKSYYAGLGAGVGATIPLAFSKAIWGTMPAVTATGVRGALQQGRVALNEIPKALSKTGNFIRRSEIAGAGKLAKLGNAALRSAKSATVAAPAGALYGAGESPTGQEFAGAGRGAGLGAAFGGASPVVGAALGKLNEKTIYPTFDLVRNKSKQLYALADELGGQFSPKVIDDVAAEGKKLLPKGEVAKALIKADEADDFIASIAEQSGKKLSLDDFESIDRHLGDRASDTLGNNEALSRKYTALQGALRESVENPANIIGTEAGIKAQREATRLWGVSRRMRDIERIVRDARYSNVPSTSIKNGFARIAKSDKLMRGYNKTERKAIERAARTGKLDGVFKTFGSRLNAIIGGAISGVPGAAIGYGASVGGRTVAEAMKKGQAGTVARQLGKRSGLTRTEKRIDVEKLKKLPLNRALQKNHGGSQ